MTTLCELQARWDAKRAEAQRLGQLVSYAVVCADVLRDLQELADTSDAVTVSLADAARTTGYHSGSIARMIKRGDVANHGTARRPRVKLSDLPHKRPRHPATTPADTVLSLDAVASRQGRRA